MKKILIAIPVIITIALFLMYTPSRSPEYLKTKYATGNSAFMNLQGMDVHYRDEGPRGDSIPLVLIHGTSSSLLTWDATAAHWSTYKRVIRMDLPGFAITGPRADEDYSLKAYVDFIHAFLGRLGVNKCYMAGNSLGGGIAFSYAAAHPSMVEGLILLDPAGYPIINAKGNLGFKIARTPVLKELMKIITPRSVVHRSLEDVYGNKNLVTDSLAEVYHDMLLREGNRAALVRRMNMMQSSDTTIITGIRVRTMIIWGDQDQLIPVDNAYKFSRDLPNDTLVIMKGIGHVPMEESPKEVALLVDRFIRR